MLQYLRLDPRCKTVLKGDRQKAVREITSLHTRKNFLSADLTAATDRISHPIALALWEGLLQGGHLSDRDVEILHSCLGPQRLVYPCGTIIDSTCGILMGLPLSWVTLSLL
jgi:hypothetical protein